MCARQDHKVTVVNDSETNLSFCRYDSLDRRRRKWFSTCLEKSWFEVFPKHYNAL